MFISYKHTSSTGPQRKCQVLGIDGSMGKMRRGSVLPSLESLLTYVLLSFIEASDIEQNLGYTFSLHKISHLYEIQHSFSSITVSKCHN